MIKNIGFEVVVSSDIQYEKLCAEIYYNGDFVGIITQEKGLENAIIEIYPPKNRPQWTFDYSGFIKVLESARDFLQGE